MMRAMPTWRNAVSAHKSWKKAIAVLVVFSLVCSSLILAPQANASGDAGQESVVDTMSGVINLLQNPGFEQPPAADGSIPSWKSWTSEGDAVTGVASDVAKNGQQSAHISATIKGTTVLSQTVAVESETSYALTYWVKTSDIDPAGNAHVRIQFLDAANVKTGPNYIVGNVTGSNDWSYDSSVFTTPAGTVKIWVDAVMFRAHGQAWFDDLMVYDTEQDASIGFLSFDASLKNTGSVALHWTSLLLSNDPVTYTVHRSTTSEFLPNAGNRIAVTSANAYIDRTVASNQQYYYRIVMDRGGGAALVESDEASAVIPQTLPAVQPVQSLQAIRTINREVQLAWTLTADQRADAIKLYASGEPITEQNKAEATQIMPQSPIDPATLQYVIDGQVAQYIKPYYAVSLVDGDGNESAVVSAAAYSILPVIDEQAPLPQHPYLFATQSDIDAVKQQMTQYPWLQMTYNMLIANAEDAIVTYGSMTEPLPKNNSGHRTAADAARLLSFAYVLTDDERYAATAKHILLLYADYYRNHDFIFNQTKDDGYMVVPLAWAYDFIYNSAGLSAAEKQQIEDDYFREAVARLKTVWRGRMNGQGMTNWAIATVGFLLRDQAMLNEAFDRDGYGLKYNWLNGINDDSYWWEQSIGYHEERTENTVLLAEAAHNSNYDLYGYLLSGSRDIEYIGRDAPRHIEGRPVEVEGKSIKELLDFPLYFMFPDLSRPVFGDSDPTSLLPKYAYEFGYSHYGDPKYGWLLSQAFGPTRAGGGVHDYFSIFAAQPELPAGATFSIGNGQFNKQGYNKLGSSVFQDSGSAILRSEGDYQHSTNLAMQWNRFGTIGHSHGDKLGIVLFGLGKEILSDPGRYTYGSMGQKEYAKHTIAHNTVVVDEKSQYPYTDNDDEWVADAPDRTSRGEAKAISIGPVLKLIQAGNSNVYADQGVELERTVAQIDDYIIDVFKAESTSSGVTHRYDYPLTINGQLEQSSVTLQALPPEETLGSTMGYKHIRQLSKGMAQDVWSTHWDLGDDRKFRTTMLGAGETEVIKGAGLSKNGQHNNQLLIGRRDLREDTLFYNVLEPYRAADAQRTITPLAVQQTGSTPGDAYAAEIASASGTVKDILLAGMTAGMKQAGALTSDGEVAFRREVSGQDQALAVVNGSHAAGTDWTVSLSAAGTVQLTRLSQSAIRVDYDGGQTAQLSIGGLPAYGVYELALKDVNEWTPVASSYSNGALTFTAEPGKIYLAGNEADFGSLPLPLTVPMGFPQQGPSPSPGKLAIIESALSGQLVEAEDFVYEDGGNVTIAFKGGSHTTNHPQGDAFYGWDSKGHVLKWEANVTQGGYYRIMLRYATRVYNSVREFRIDDGDAHLFHFPTTPGWNDRRNALLQTVQGEDLLFYLEPGTHTITMENTSGALNLDYFVLEMAEDTTAPQIEIAKPVNGSYLTSDNLLPTFQITDDSSGVDESNTPVTLDGTVIDPSADIPLYTLPLGAHAFTVTASDHAGNTASQSVTFHTESSVESLQTLSLRFAGEGWITSMGLLNSLLSKLRSGNLEAFIHAVEAQRGKHIAAEAAAYLLRDAQSLLVL